MSALSSSVSAAKADLASAISNKGITTASDATYDTMVNNINNIITLNQGTSSATVGASDILKDKIGFGKDGVKLTGTMVNNGAVSASLAANGTYTIPAGFHNGGGKIT
jgi:hypothetical protein